MRKHGLVLALLLALALSCSAYAKNDAGVTYDIYRKVAPQLYEVTVDSYDYEHAFKDKRSNRQYFMGCSIIRQGNYLGRNFDFFAGDVPEIVVKTPAKEGRYASVGMVGGLMWLHCNLMDAGLDASAKKLIPLLLLDGINEKGLVVGINCVNTKDVGGMTRSTNPGRKKVAQLCVVRYLLDHAASADEAVALMKDIDIVNDADVMGLVLINFEVHFLIADKDKSYVVEFNNSRPEGQKLVVMEGETVMTNFYQHKADPKKNVFPANAVGVERYRKLVDNRNAVTSMDSMKALMRSIRFSNSNRQDGEYAPGKGFENPFTCYSDHPVFGKEVINYANHRKHIRTILDEMQQDEARVTAMLQDPKLANPHNLWVTSHSSVYDIANRTMSVAVYERFAKYHDYAPK